MSFTGQMLILRASSSEAHLFFVVEPKAQLLFELHWTNVGIAGFIQ